MQRTRCRPAIGTAGRGRSAFTLIELLVVVSIIALLISILLPSLRKAREQAKKVKCMANLRDVGLALQSYAFDNKQFIPAYETMGRHFFRIAPRTRLTPTAPEESWGLQSVLEAGEGPTILPSGLAYPLPVDVPIYLPGNSDVWLCPSNPGLFGWETEWKKWGNTYNYRTNSSGTYSLDKLASGKGMWKNPLVWDNYVYLPGESGFIGPFKGSGYRIEQDKRRAPHRTGGLTSKSATQHWIGAYADGHCQLNGMND